MGGANSVHAIISARRNKAKRSQSFDLSAIGLEAVPPGKLLFKNLDNLIELLFDINKITHFNWEELRLLKKLRVLKASCNLVTSIQIPPDLPIASTLTDLDLSHNQLTEFPTSLVHLPQLLQLNLGWNCITHIPGDVIAPLTQLGVLNIRANYISQLPEELCQLPRLVSLNVKLNQLTRLPGNVRNMTNLMELNFVENPITEFPADLLTLQNLQFLFAWSGKIRSLPYHSEGAAAETLRPPKSAREVSPVQFLDVSANQITELPANFILRVPFLTKLNLSHNNLTSLPPAFGNLTHLTLLNLSHNQLRTLPREIGRLTKLTEIHLRNNRLVALPPDLANLIHIRSLVLSENCLGEELDDDGNLPAGAMAPLPSELWHAWGRCGLVELNLAMNHLSLLPPDIGRLTALVHLNVAFNRLTCLPRELANAKAFTAPKQGDHPKLLLSYNRLREVPPVLLALTAVEDIELSGNALASVPPEVFIKLTALRTLSIGNNHGPLALPVGALKSASKLQRLYMRGTSVVAASVDVVSTLSSPSAADAHTALAAVLPELPLLFDLDVSTDVDTALYRKAKLPLNVPDSDMERGQSARCCHGNIAYTVGWAKKIGLAGKNEDVIVFRGDVGGRLLGNQSLAYFAVFDGHGGKETSRFAGDKFHEILEGELAATADGGVDPMRALEAAFWTANRQLEAFLEKQNIPKRSGSTACVVIVTTDGRLIAAGVGDSRAVLGRVRRTGTHGPRRRVGDAVAVTVDHKPNLPDEIRRIKSKGGMVLEDVLGTRGYRVVQPLANSGGLAVSRALGDFMFAPSITVEPYITSQRLFQETAERAEDNRDNDEMLLVMGCDGLWDVVENNQAIELALREEDPERAAVTLRDAAVALQSGDDTCVIVVRFERIGQGTAAGK